MSVKAAGCRAHSNTPIWCFQFAASFVPRGFNINTEYICSRSVRGGVYKHQPECGNENCVWKYTLETLRHQPAVQNESLGYKPSLCRDSDNKRSFKTQPVCQCGFLTCASTGSPSPAQWFLTAGLCCTLAGAARCRCRSGGCRAPICYSKVERWQCNETDRWGVSSADSLHSFAQAKRRAEAFDTELQWDLRTFSSYQAGVAVIETQLSGYIPVGVLLHVRHIWKLDGRAELFKLQLQTRGFLHERRGWEGERSLGGGITVFTQRCMCQQVMRRIRR